MLDQWAIIDGDRTGRDRDYEDRTRTGTGTETGAGNWGGKNALHHSGTRTLSLAGAGGRTSSQPCLGVAQ